MRMPPVWWRGRRTGGGCKTRRRRSLAGGSRGTANWCRGRSPCCRGWPAGGSESRSEGWRVSRSSRPSTSARTWEFHSAWRGCWACWRYPRGTGRSPGRGGSDTWSSSREKTTLETVWRCRPVSREVFCMRRGCCKDERNSRWRPGGQAWGDGNSGCIYWKHNHQELISKLSCQLVILCIEFYNFLRKICLS